MAGARLVDDIRLRKGDLFQSSLGKHPQCSAAKQQALHHAKS
jgi:hypothetical protein